MKKFPILFSLLFMLSGCATQLPDETENTKEKIKKLEKQAESGDAKALNDLGVMYHYGRGVKQDFEKAYSYYKKAVKKGNAKAATHLGSMYCNGHGVVQSNTEAQIWYKKSVELDPSDFNLCTSGLHKNRAFSSLILLAHQNIPAAQFELGQNYHFGTQHVPINPKEAMKWYIKAAEGNSGEACAYLHMMYRDGAHLCNIAKNQEEAEKWLKKAEALNVDPSWLESRF